MKTYLEFKEGKSQKFWSIDVQGTGATVKYGKIGSEGRTQIKEFDSVKAAQEAAEKLIKQKEKRDIHAPRRPYLRTRKFVNLSS